MSDLLQAQIEKVHASIASLEAQRSILGDENVNTAISALRQQLATLEEQVSQQAGPIEERRLISILFIDIVGSTNLAEKLDPEEWRSIVSQVHTAIGEAITTHHGEVAQYLGDGLLAFFGSKQASEHDPENAIRAALDSHTSVASLKIAQKVELRAGIHSGLVVVGELGDAAHKEFTASGDAMNLAARLQSVAPPGGTLISHDTYRYVRGVFNLTPQPSLAVKGKSEPLQTYLVRSAKPRPFRTVTRGVAGVETRTIGREQEMQALQAAYLRSYQGHGLVWTQLLGEPGVGKSRLMDDIRDWLELRDETFLLLRARAFPDDANQPFELIRRMWFDRFQIAEDAPLQNAEAKWVECFKEFSGLNDSEEPAHALGLLAGLTFENSPHLKGLRDDPAQVKGRALVVSRELFTAMRQQSPVVILLEDLQWADSASWEYLMEVFYKNVGAEQPNGLFILGAARAEWQPPQELLAWFASPSSAEMDRQKWGTLINLPPLTSSSINLLVQELFQYVVDVPQQVIELLVERSEGVPYFTEEIVNWFIDHEILDTHSKPWLFFPERLNAQPLPDTLQHLLLTRLNALNLPERTALQRGSIFGRHFWTGGVEALGISAGAETFAHLQPRGFVDMLPESSFQGDIEWIFHQNMLQEVAYGSVLKRERAALHKMAAGWLETQARQAGRLEEFAGLLGNHYERARELSLAADWYLLAGRRAMHQGAGREAKGFYSQALNLLPPIDQERRWLALLGREEALNLLSDDAPWQADLEACLELAHALDNDNYLAEAYFRQAVFGLHTGNFSVLDKFSRQALAAAKRGGNEVIEAKALILAALSDARRGDKAVALQKLEQGLQLARSLADQNTLYFILLRSALCYDALAIFSSSYPLYVELLELTHRAGNRYWEASVLGNFSDLYLNFGLYKQGQVMTERAVQIFQAINAHRGLAYYLCNLARIYYRTGNLRQANLLVQQAGEEISQTQDVRGKINVLIWSGIIALAIDDVPGAAKYFIEGRQFASGHDMPGYACNNTVGLAACEVRQGRLEEARKYNFEAWEYQKEYGPYALDFYAWAYLTCAETFDALGEAENAREMIDFTRHKILELADTLNIPEWRNAYLKDVPEVRTILEMWERNRR